MIPKYKPGCWPFDARPEFIARYRRLVATEPNSPERCALRRCFCLVADDAGPLHGTLCATEAKARVLAADRRANGEAFPDERPMALHKASEFFYGCVTERDEFSLPRSGLAVLP